MRIRRRERERYRLFEQRASSDFTSACTEAVGISNELPTLAREGNAGEQGGNIKKQVGLNGGGEGSLAGCTPQKTAPRR